MFKTTIIFNIKNQLRNIFAAFAQIILEMKREKYIFWFPVFMGIGIFLVFESFFNNPYYSIALILFGPLLCIKSTRKLFLALFFGAMVASARLYFLSDHKMLDTDIDFVKLKGVIEKDELIKNGHRITVLTKFGKLQLRSQIKGVSGDCFLPGNKILFKAKLYPFLDNNIGYNFYRHAFFDQYYAKGVLLTKPIVAEKVKRTQLSIYLEKIRAHINNRINDHFSKDTKGIAQALVTGDKGDISNNVKDHYAKSGIAHILAISGLHITLIGGMIFLALRYILLLFPFIALRFDIKKLAITFSFIASGFYVLIAGSRIPALRALLMYAIIMIAILMDRTAVSLRNVAIAAVVILIFIPESINNPGFFMSFFVVASLISYYEDLEKSDGYFQGIVVSSVIASLAVIPFSWYFFNQVVGNGITANLLSIPLLGGVIMPFMIIFILGFSPIAIIPEFGIKLLNLIAEIVKSFDFLFFYVPTPNLIVVSIGVFGLLILIINKRREIGLPLIFVSLMLHIIMPKPFLFFKNDLSVFGIKDGENFYVNDMIKARSVTNLWRQISGAKQKLKLKLNNNKYCTNDYTIETHNNTITVKGKNYTKEVQKSELSNNMNIIINK